MSGDRDISEVCRTNGVGVALEMFDFAVLSFRETGRIDELKEMTRYVFAQVRKVVNPNEEAKKELLLEKGISAEQYLNLLAGKITVAQAQGVPA